MDAVPQGAQRLVDELGLLHALPHRLRLAQPLAASQIHQPQLGMPHITCAQCLLVGAGLS